MSYEEINNQIADAIKKQGVLHKGDVLQIPEGTTQTIKAYGGDIKYVLTSDCKIYVHDFEYNYYITYPTPDGNDATWSDGNDNMGHCLYKVGGALHPVIHLPDGTQVDDWSYFRVDSE